MPLYTIGTGRALFMAPTAAAGATTTWNPADKNANLTLSGGDLIFTQGAFNDYASLRSVASASSGKKYWELTATTIGGAALTVEGFGNSTMALNTYLGANTNSMGWVGDGRVLLNDVTVTTIQTWAQGDTLCFALDLDNSKVWFRTNGGNWNNDVIGNQNPATNTGGASLSGIASGPYFVMAQGHATGDSMTANFGATAYAQTAPSGFGNW
jgi:hypothetical protein